MAKRYKVAITEISSTTAYIEGGETSLEDDRTSYPKRSINRNRGSAATFSPGPEGNEGATVAPNPFGPAGKHDGPR